MYKLLLLENPLFFIVPNNATLWKKSETLANEMHRYIHQCQYCLQGAWKVLLCEVGIHTLRGVPHFRVPSNQR